MTQNTMCQNSLEKNALYAENFITLYIAQEITYKKLVPTFTSQQTKVDEKRFDQRKKHSSMH